MGSLAWYFPSTTYSTVPNTLGASPWTIAAPVLPPQKQHVIMPPRNFIPGQTYALHFAHRTNSLPRVSISGIAESPFPCSANGWMPRTKGIDEDFTISWLCGIELTLQRM